MTTGHKSTPPVRQRDPTARRMLADLLALEEARWPEARPVYAAALLCLATRCERVGARAEVYRWASREFGGLLMHRNERVRECRADALADLVAEVAGTLLRFRAGLDDDRWPNLTSMLRASLLWTAKDHYRSRHGRHIEREAPELREDDRPAPGHSEARTLANEILALIADDAPPSRALRMVGLGFSVAEAARATGASRQQVYRARDGLRARVADAENE